MSPWDSARKEAISKYCSSNFRLQNSEPKRISLLYKRPAPQIFQHSNEKAEGYRETPTAGLYCLDPEALPSCPVLQKFSVPPGNPSLTLYLGSSDMSRNWVLKHAHSQPLGWVSESRAPRPLAFRPHCAFHVNAFFVQCPRSAAWEFLGWGKAC